MRINIKENISLKPYNSFGIDVKAGRFVSIKSIDDLKEIISDEKDFFLIGGGSNMLLLNDIDRIVIHINTKGKKIIKQDENHVWVQVAAGENWHEFVLWCLENDFGGVENLALIPGNVGTAPIQNIGAYGVEVKDVIVEVYTIEIATRKETIFSNSECKFGYRDSIFKNLQKGKYIITGVSFKLTTNNHTIHDNYGAIQSKLTDRHIDVPCIANVADAVISIRTEKLPDPKEIGNSGSFFKNPIVSEKHFNKLIQEYLNIPNYPVPNDTYSKKLAAGWLIDQCGFKGKRYGDAGVHKNQALVLVNYGNATGREILNLAYKIQNKVQERFGVALEMEVNIIS